MFIVYSVMHTYAQADQYIYLALKFSDSRYIYVSPYKTGMSKHFIHGRLCLHKPALHVAAPKL